MTAAVCAKNSMATAPAASVLPRRQYGLPFPSDAPPAPGLAADEQTIETMLSSEYWRRICPQLSVGGVGLSGGGAAAAQTPPSPLAVSDDDLHTLHKLLDVEGYFTLPPHCMPWGAGLMEKLAVGVVQLMQCGWSPAFICMYDEAWWDCNAVDEMMQKVTGGNRNNMDFLAWYIDPGAPVSDGGTGPAAGFAPHRDRQPRDIPASFREVRCENCRSFSESPSEHNHFVKTGSSQDRLGTSITGIRRNNRGLFFPAGWRGEVSHLLAALHRCEKRNFVSQRVDAKNPSFYQDRLRTDIGKVQTKVAFSLDATPENSCLYLIPKSCDPSYIEGDEMEVGTPAILGFSLCLSRACLGKMIIFIHK